MSDDPPFVTVEAVTEVPESGWAYWLTEDLLLRRTPSGTIIGVGQYLFTWGVLRGVDEFGYSERWCYPNLPAALVNAAALDDESEPVDFIRKVGHE